jgi:hypothetical protein
MRKGILVLLGLLLASVAAAQTKLEVKDLQNHPFDVPFPAESHLRVHLQGGDFRVVGTDDNRIVVRFTGRNAEQARNLTVRLTEDSKGNDLRISHGPRNDLQVTVEIPAHTDLYVRMSGGDLNLVHVIGNKDVSLVGGDLKIDAGNPSDYARVSASVRFGDVYAPDFGEAKGWMGGSINTTGPGKYTLHAHVFAGDLTLHSSR